MNPRLCARVERSTSEVEVLRTELDRWLEHRRDRDGRRQYATQLSTLESVLHAGLSDVAENLDGLDRAADPGDVYAACAGADHGVLWVRRVWEYFREKFDQRDDPALAPLLAAADEVVWSCWAEPFERAGSPAAGASAPSPAPLPYIEALHAPQAFLRGRPPPGVRPPSGVPAELRREMDEFLRRLPIPVVALPATVPRAPWLLALLPHEVGHHLQAELVPGQALVEAFGVWVAAAVEPGGDRWRYWSGELFADAMGTFAMGPAALWVTAETILAGSVAMLRPEVLYPPPAVRLSFLEALCRSVQAPPPAGIVPGLDDWVDGPPLQDGGGDLRARARELAAQADALAAQVAGWAPDGLDPLPALAGWDAHRFHRDVPYWREMLSGLRDPYPEEARHAARTLAAATTLACADALAGAGAAEEVARITERALPLLAASREPGTRAASAPAEAPATLGHDLARLIRRSPVPA